VQEQQAGLIDSRENLFSKLQHQSSTRKITRASVPWMVARLGLQWYSASFRCFVIPIVQQVVEENNIAGIQSDDEYDELPPNLTSCCWQSCHGGDHWERTFPSPGSLGDLGGHLRAKNE
jgi:hypothetical protein